MSYTQPAPPPPETQRILDLERELTELSAHINAANFRLLELIAEFDEMVGWGLYGCMSCAHWLNWQCGIGMNAAREKVRVARALESLPKITEDFRCGRLSYSKVRAMTRAATPENEAYFVEVGRLGTAAHVEKLARAYRGVVRELTSDEANRRYRKRYLEWYHDDDGSVVISARLTPEDGAVVIKALDQAREALWHEQREERQRAMERKAAGNNAKVGPGTPGFWPLMDYRTRQDVSAETPEDPRVWDDYTNESRGADSLVRIAECALHHGTGGVPNSDRFQITVHVSAETLPQGSGTEHADCCELDTGVHVSAETARRIGCDASRVLMVDGIKGEPLSIGRKSRVIPPAMRRALDSRDGHCVFPGCTHRHGTQAHHIEHWADGGETSLQNLALLCRHHHRLVHEGGFGMRKHADDTFIFTRPSGERIDPVPSQPCRSDAHQIARLNAERGLDIDSQTGVTLWGGESMDYNDAITGLLADDGIE